MIYKPIWPWLDAGYVSLENMASLFSAGIEFVSRLPEKSKDIYNNVQCIFF